MGGTYYILRVFRVLAVTRCFNVRRDVLEFDERRSTGGSVRALISNYGHEARDAAFEILLEKELALIYF